jgi:hypothetical protein
MFPRTLSPSVLATGAVAALGFAAAAPAASADPVPAPPTASRALLDITIGGPIGVLLADTTPTTVLTVPQIAVVVDGLPALTEPEAAALIETLSPQQLTAVVAGLPLADLTGLLQGLPAAGVEDVVGSLDPATLVDLVGTLDPATLADLLAGMTPAQVAELLQTLDPQALADLLDGVAGTPGAPTSFAALLGGLGSSAGSLVDGLLPGGAAAPSAGQVGALLEQLRALLDADAPMGDPAVARALADVLDRVTHLLGVEDVVELPVLGPLLSGLLTATDALPEPVRGAVDGLISTLRDVPGAGPLLDELGLGSAGGGGTGGGGAGGGGAGGADGAAGSGSGAGGSAGGSGSNGGSGATGAAGAAGASGTAVPPGAVAAVPTPTPAKKLAGATIRSISITKDRRRIRVRLTCPKTAKASCVVTTSVTVRGASVAKGRRITIKRGKTRTLTVKVATRRAGIVRRAGGRVVVRAATKGATAPAARKSRTVRRIAR